MILQEKSNTIGLLFIQIDKYENANDFFLIWFDLHNETLGKSSREATYPIFFIIFYTDARA